MNKPSEIYKTGFNCAESIIKAYNDEKEEEKLPVCAGSSMGSGMGSLSACGAVISAGMIIGLETGRNEPKAQNDAKPYTKELVEAVRKKFGSEICRELKSNKVSCTEIIDFTYEKMNEILQKAKESK